MFKLNVLFYCMMVFNAFKYMTNKKTKKYLIYVQNQNHETSHPRKQMNLQYIHVEDPPCHVPI